MVEKNTIQVPFQDLADIANQVLGFPTLESRNMDSLDFRDVGVGSLKEALEKAFLLGLNFNTSVSDPFGLYSTSSNAVLLQKAHSVDDSRGLNPFTSHLKNLADSQGYALVQLANGSFDKIKFTEFEEDGHVGRAFVSEHTGLRWTAQGRCFTSCDYDIVALG